MSEPPDHRAPAEAGAAHDKPPPPTDPPSKTHVMLLLGVLGWLLSYAMFLKFLLAHQWDFFGGWTQAFTSSDFGTGLLLDLVAVTAMMVALAIGDRRRLGTRGALLVVACLGLSVSMSLAVYLLTIWRHERRARMAGAAALSTQRR